MNNNNLPTNKIINHKNKIWKFLLIFLSLDLFIVSAIICTALLSWKEAQPICLIMIIVIIFRPFFAAFFKVHKILKWYSSAVQITLSRVPGRRGQGVGDLYFSIFFFPLFSSIVFLDCLTKIKKFITKGTSLPYYEWTKDGGKKDWREE